MSHSGATLLMRSLEAMGTEMIFGYPGGAIMPVYDALVDSSIKHVLVRHEQGAALAADGYSRATGKVGVCMATSGPGATNLVTGIANAHLDSIPMIAITGQVAAEFMGTDAFQEVDIFGITLPIVKHSYIVKSADDIPRIVQEAFHIATEGRPGPVLIDLPKNVAIAESDAALDFSTDLSAAPIVPTAEQIQAAVELINQSEKPILYIGGGIGMADAVEDFRSLAREVGIPVVSTLKGLGTLPGDDDQFIGMMGMHGNQAANLSVQESDLLICLGARFDDRATGKLDEFAPHARVIHVDTDPSEISKLRKADVGIIGNLSQVFEGLKVARPKIASWVEKTKDYRTEHAWRYDAPGEGVYAPAMLKRLTELNPDLLVACDVGQHQMWVAQHCRFERPERHLTSGGLGTMGYGLPAAIGAKLGDPNLDVLCVTGDGSIMMNIQELATIKRYNIGVKVLLFDNQSLGLVRQWQELFFEERYSEVDLSDNPDFVQVAESFGIPAFRVRRREQVEGAIERLLSTEGPIFAHVCIDTKANVWPLVPPGRSNSQMMDAKSWAT